MSNMISRTVASPAGTAAPSARATSAVREVVPADLPADAGRRRWSSTSVSSPAAQPRNRPCRSSSSCRIRSRTRSALARSVRLNRPAVTRWSPSGARSVARTTWLQPSRTSRSATSPVAATAQLRAGLGLEHLVAGLAVGDRQFLAGEELLGGQRLPGRCPGSPVRWPLHGRRTRRRSARASVRPAASVVARSTSSAAAPRPQSASSTSTAAPPIEHLPEPSAAAPSARSGPHRLVPRCRPGCAGAGDRGHRRTGGPGRRSGRRAAAAGSARGSDGAGKRRRARAPAGAWAGRRRSSGQVGPGLAGTPRMRPHRTRTDTPCRPE